MQSMASYVVLERVRETASFLRKSSVSSELVSDGKSIVSVLKELQNSVRYGDIAAIDPRVILFPFLRILRSHSISGPFVRNSIDAIQAFLTCGVFSPASEHLCEALSDVVDTVTKCKFVHTDTSGDELVHLHIIETLRIVMVSSSLKSLSDACQWKIMQFCLATVLKSGGPGGSMIIYQAAERAVCDCISRLLRHSGQGGGHIDADSGNPAPEGKGACICRVLNYLVKVISEAAAERSSAAAVGSDKGTPGHKRSLSQQQHLPPEPPMNELSHDRATLHLLFALKTLNYMLTAKHHVHIVRQLVVRSKEFARILTDDFGYSLLQLCSASVGNGANSKAGAGGGPQAQQFNAVYSSTTVLSAVMNAFGALLRAVGPRLRILLECFVRQVFLKALIHTQALFIEQLQYVNEGVDLIAPLLPISTSVGGAAQDTGSNSNSFRLDDLQVIFESLCDLLSDVSVLPSWFASFDCDPTSADLVQPLVLYLCRCNCLVLSYSTELTTGYFRGVGLLVTQMFKQVMKTLVARNEKRENLQARARSSSGAPSGEAIGSLTLLDAQKEHALSSLLKASRGAKHILAEAARLFVQKPEKGLRYLQQIGALPTPLTPESVAAFLRLAPDLPRETSGAYLGELGKDSAAYECNDKEFHRLVLLRYVESFEFTDQSVVDCMRIFLSAFRLPGEAQQIDRILVAFSEHCYSQCVEGKLGILENAEVTYVLTFSIIMLNTDRHNPNVRTDRKMTLEQFIRNNTNYGVDAHQTIPLTKELLSTIYASIDGCPIRTEGKEIAGAVTNEVWTDLQMQARVHPRKAILVSTQQQNGAFLAELLHVHSPEVVESDRKELSTLLRENSPIEGAHGNSTAYIVRKLLDSQHKTSLVADPVLLSLEISGLHGLFDADLLECVWLDMLRVCMCVHIHNALVMQQVVAIEFDRASAEPSTQRSPAVLKPPVLRKLLSTTNAFLVDLLRVTNSHHMSCVMDCAGLSLVLGAGMIKGTLAEKFLSFLRWDAAAADSHAPSQVGTLGQKAFTFDGTIADSSLLLYQLRHFESARSSASTFLNLIQNNQAYVASWSVVWYFLGGLRDCGVLPREMVVDVDADLLPPNVREEFEEVLLELDRKTFEQHRPIMPKRVRRQSSSILSLQGLGEALFGGASDDGDQDSPGDGNSVEADAYNAELVGFKHLFRLDAVSARWDSGYEITQASASASASTTRIASADASGAHSPGSSRANSPLPSSPLPPLPLGRHRTSRDQMDAAVRATTKTIPPFSIVDGGMTIEDLRLLVANSGAAQLVSDSRFLSEANLESLLKSLVYAAEAKDEFLRTDAFPISPRSTGSSNKNSPVPGTAEGGKDLEQSVSATQLLLQQAKAAVLGCQGALNIRHSFSSSTVAWLEMVLVEVSLRNRDRFNTFWPILRHHYVRVLSGPHVTLSYITERRVLGVLKICTRMVSRDHFSGTILELLGRIFARHNPAAASSFGSQKGNSMGGSVKLQSLSRDEAAEDGYSLKPPYTPMASHVLSQLTNQISAAMWRVLTLNVEVLPLLPLEQWQILFSIIAIAASAGGFSAIKSFESMAWLLHEPRLIAKVPVFCIIGVKPLLRNQQAPLSVSIGAVHLLTHLHSRLEVLIKDESEDYVDCEYDESGAEGDTPLLWESCWTPILRALVEGIADPRTPVREACAEALCQAILDRHSQAVPAGVLVDILGGIISPMIIQLRDHLVEEVNRGLPSTIPRILSSKEAAAASQQQWVTVDAEPSSEGSSSAAAGALVATHERGGGTVSSLMECLSALCKSFLQHLKKLSSYPSFDKLWLCILNVLGNFLDSQLHGSEELAAISRAWDSLSEDTRHVAQDLFAMLNSSRDHLLRMTRALVDEKVFTSRPGLLSVTKDTVMHFDGCTEVIAELNLV